MMTDKDFMEWAAHLGADDIEAHTKAKSRAAHGDIKRRLIGLIKDGMAYNAWGCCTNKIQVLKHELADAHCSIRLLEYVLKRERKRAAKTEARLTRRIRKLIYKNTKEGK